MIVKVRKPSNKKRPPFRFTRQDIWAAATVIQLDLEKQGVRISRTEAIRRARSRYGGPPPKQKKKKGPKNRLKWFTPDHVAQPQREVSQAKSKAARLNILRKWAEVKVANPTPPDQVRTEYDNSWPTRTHPQKLCCRVCFQVMADCYHHIVQIQNGGGNERGNLLPVCNPCHADIHPWLKEPAVPIKGTSVSVH